MLILAIRKEREKILVFFLEIFEMHKTESKVINKRLTNFIAFTLKCNKDEFRLSETEYETSKETQKIIIILSFIKIFFLFFS